MSSALDTTLLIHYQAELSHEDGSTTSIEGDTTAPSSLLDSVDSDLNVAHSEASGHIITRYGEDALFELTAVDVDYEV